MTELTPFNNWMHGAYRNDPLDTFNGLTSCERPEDALAVFTTREGQQIEASSRDLFRLRRRLEIEIRAIPGGPLPSLAQQLHNMEQLRILQEATRALNERRNMGLMAPGADATLFITSLPVGDCSAQFAQQEITRIARNSTAAAREPLHMFLNTILTGLEVKRQQQTAPARAAKAAKRAHGLQDPS